MNEIVFLTIGAAGAILLLSSVILGDLFDFFHIFNGFDGLLSTTSLGLAALLFGGNGYFMMVNGSSSATAIGFGILWAAIGFLFAVFLEKWLISKTVKVTHNIVGQTGTAVTKIDTHLGKVLVNHYSETNPRFAFSDSEIPAGAEVIVLEEIDGKVKVATVTEKEK